MVGHALFGIRGQGCRGVLGTTWNEPAVFLVPSKTMPPTTFSIESTSPGSHRAPQATLRFTTSSACRNTRGTYEGLLKLQPDSRPFVMTRASYAGGQRFSATWTGSDNSEHLEPPQANHTATAQPRAQRLRDGRCRRGRICGLSATGTAHALARGCSIPSDRPRSHSHRHQSAGASGENGTAEDLSLRRSLSSKSATGCCLTSTRPPRR